MSRWYDSEPTVSMAVSLLQSSPMRQQQAVVEEALAHIRHSYPACDTPQSAHPGVVFFQRFRFGWSAELWQLMACLQEMAVGDRQSMALWILEELVHVDQFSGAPPHHHAIS